MIDGLTYDKANSAFLDTVRNNDFEAQESARVTCYRFDS